MSEVLKIQTGSVRLDVERDGEAAGSICFNPASVEFARAFYALFESLDEKERSYTQKAKALETGETDENGIPYNMGEQLQLTQELFEQLRSEFDALFGVGTCDIVFGEKNSFDAFISFLDGITPYVSKARSAKTEKYLKSANRDTRRKAAKAKLV